MQYKQVRLIRSIYLSYICTFLFNNHQRYSDSPAIVSVNGIKALCNSCEISFKTMPRRHNYRPDLIAQNLKRRLGKAIGVVVSTMLDEQLALPDASDVINRI